MQLRNAKTFQQEKTMLLPLQFNIIMIGGINTDRIRVQDCIKLSFDFAI
jgi:hypothetical protein